MASLSRTRIEKPPGLGWRRDENGRLSRAQPRGRPDVGDGKGLEVFWHVDRGADTGILPPPKALWRQKKGRANQIRYIPIWVDIEQRIAVPQRRSSLADDLPNGVLYLYTCDASTKGFDKSWRPFDIIGNGCYGLILSYVDDSLPLDRDLVVSDNKIRVAKFNYKDGDLTQILRPVVLDLTSRAKSSVREGHDHYVHCQTVTDGRGRGGSDILDKPTAQGMYSQENTIQELLNMTGSPHVPRMWGISVPEQTGTLLTMEYIPGGRTLDQHLEFVLKTTRCTSGSSGRLTLCIAKALSAMAYGSEDPAPSHRVCGWNKVVHVDWSLQKIFVVRDMAGHTCSHAACYKVGDFGFAMVLPYTPAPRARFQDGELKRPWLSRLCPPELPEANWDHDLPQDNLRADPIAGHFSYETNIYLMANMWNNSIPGTVKGRTGLQLYGHDDLNARERALLSARPMTQLPASQRVRGSNRDGSGGRPPSWPRPRGYVDVAESLAQRNGIVNVKIAKQRYVQLMRRCLDRDLSRRPDIEEMMLQAGQGIEEVDEVPDVHNPSDK